MVVLTVLSPMFLPSLNLMLDVPCVALGLGALALFCRACGRRSLILAVLAGLVAGLAIQREERTTRTHGISGGAVPKSCH